jgi:hypothetical protein
VLSRDVSLAAATALCSGSSDNPAQHPSSTGTLHTPTSASITDPVMRHCASTKRKSGTGHRYLEKHEARRAAAAATRAAEGAEREAAAERPAAEATRAAARKQVEAISPRRPATETGDVFFL